jgi:hypothetical protein
VLARLALALVALTATLSVGSASASQVPASAPAPTSVAVATPFTSSTALDALRDVWADASPEERRAACSRFRTAPASALASETPEVAATVRTFYALSCR